MDSDLKVLYILLQIQDSEPIANKHLLRAFAKDEIYKKRNSMDVKKFIYAAVTCPLRECFLLVSYFINQISKELKEACTKDYISANEGQSKGKKKKPLNLGTSYILSEELRAALLKDPNYQLKEEKLDPDGNKSADGDNEKKPENQVAGEQASTTQKIADATKKTLKPEERKTLRFVPTGITLSHDLYFTEQIKTLMQTNLDDPNFNFLRNWNVESFPELIESKNFDLSDNQFLKSSQVLNSEKKAQIVHAQPEPNPKIEQKEEL